MNENNNNQKIANNFRKIFSGIKTGDRLILPSKWAEENVILSKEVTTVPGRFKFSHVPYMREILDTFYPYNPAKIVAIMAGAQISKTQGLIINALLYMIENAPGNTLFLSATDDLSSEVIEGRLDPAIQACGMQHLIRPNTIRKRNQRTGDTSKSKEFAGGRLYAGGMKSIDKLVRQRSVKYGFFDDWDSAPVSHKEEGNLFELLQNRFNTSKNEMKQYYISTPKTRPSNIELIYEMGDQRKWHVQCPCCGEYIEIIWVDDEYRKYGIVYDLNENGKLIKKSIRYKCQICQGEFREDRKYELNLKGKWIPTSESSMSGLISYHIPALYAATFMYNWNDIVEKWIRIYKDGNESISKKKAFYNQTLGLPWEEKQEQIKSNVLINNTRDYQVGIIPTQLSRDDGNGEIILITCACDLNGTLDDARLDYDVWAHSESGSIYSIDQGSIGTYYSHNRNNENRTKFTYRVGHSDNVWELFETQVLKRDFVTQDGRIMKITISGVDTGWYTHYAYEFIDGYDGMCYAIKGDGKDKFRKYSENAYLYKIGRERRNLYVLEVDYIKDILSEMINKEWKQGDSQPDNFMNFPEPSGGKYLSKNYFSQFEAEHKIIQENDDGDPVGWKWEKKKSSNQNHFFDTAVYNYGLRVIFSQVFCSMKKYSIKNATWSDFAGIMKGIIGG